MASIELFRPSKEMLEFIDFRAAATKAEEKRNLQAWIYNGHCWWQFFEPLAEDYEAEKIDVTTASLFTALQQFYGSLLADMERRGLRSDVSDRKSTREGAYVWEKDWQPVAMTVHEMLSNARAHGCKQRTPYGLAMFLGVKGIAAGMMDEGGYFKREDIKRIFEARKPVIEFDKDTDSPRAGTGIIYGHADKIEVDTSQGVLWAGFSLERVLRGE